MTNLIQKLRRFGGTKSFRAGAAVATMLALIFTQVFVPPAQAALSQDDINAIYSWPLWNPNLAPSGVCSQTTTGVTTLSGSDPEEKVWNYLKAQGLSDAQAAGVMGNIQQESGFNPSAHQTPGAWTNMGTGSNQAVGLVQWDGGNRPAMIKAAEAAGLTLQDLETSSDKNLSFQLQYMWKQMQGTSPTGVKNMLAGLQVISSVTAAANYFNLKFESGSDPPAPQNPAVGIREYNAQQILKKYGGSGGGPGVGSGSGTGGCTTTTPSGSGGNCSTGTGDAKIYLCAVRYDPASYSESALGNHMPGGNPQWIKQVCPAAASPTGKITPSCFLDCSGLVNIAVYDAFGYNLEENTTVERADIGRLWKVIPFSQIQEGDIIQPGAEAGGHVEIIERVQGHTIYTFGAHTSNAPQPDQVSHVSYAASGGDLYLHWIGPTK